MKVDTMLSAEITLFVTKGLRRGHRTLLYETSVIEFDKFYQAGFVSVVRGCT